MYNAVRSHEKVCYILRCYKVFLLSETDMFAVLSCYLFGNLISVVLKLFKLKRHVIYQRLTVRYLKKNVITAS